MKTGQNQTRPVRVLIADDDEDDRLLLQMAFERTQGMVELRFVTDGQQLSDYLFRRERYRDVESAPRPDVILLDLYMPLKTGFEVLEEMMSIEDLRSIPVVIWTTSTDPREAKKSLSLGASLFFNKPDSLGETVEILNSLIAGLSSNPHPPQARGPNN